MTFFYDFFVSVSLKDDSGSGDPETDLVQTTVDSISDKKGEGRLCALALRPARSMAHRGKKQKVCAHVPPLFILFLMFFEDQIKVTT